MTIYKLHNGAYRIERRINGVNITRYYVGYALSEAKAKFRAEIRAIIESLINN